MEIRDYEYTGDWLEHLLGVSGPAEPCDDPLTRTLGYKVDGVLHRVRLTTVRMVRETFQTAAQRDKVLLGFGLEFGLLREKFSTPEGRAWLYNRGA